MLVRGRAGEQRWLVACCRARRVAAVLHEIALHCSWVTGCPATEHGRPFAVKADELLGNCLSFGRIGVQQAGWAAPLQHGSELPAQVKTILHRHIHALASLGAVGVAGIARNKNMGQSRGPLVRLHVIEAVGQPLADFIHRPPGHFFHVERIGMEDALRCGDQLIEGDVASGHALVLVQFVHLDIQPHHVAALARNHHDAAVAGRLDQCLETDVGKIRVEQDIHHAPGVVGGIALER